MAPPPTEFWAEEYEEKGMVQSLEEFWIHMSGEVRARLAATDIKMHKEYEKRRILEEMGVPHYFEAGDQVLLR